MTVWLFTATAGKRPTMRAASAYTRRRQTLVAARTGLRCGIRRIRTVSQTARTRVRERSAKKAICEAFIQRCGVARAGVQSYIRSVQNACISSDENVKRLGAAALRRLAVRARVDPRTIAREWAAARGEWPPGRTDARERARDALREAGLLPVASGRAAV